MSADEKRVKSRKQAEYASGDSCALTELLCISPAMPSALSIVMLVCSAAGVLNAMHRPEDPAVSVAAAISLKDALTDAASAYEQQGGRKVRFTFGASGELATQIQQGGAIDLFISAAHKQVDDLVKGAIVPADAPHPVVARNALVLIVPA